MRRKRPHWINVWPYMCIPTCGSVKQLKSREKFTQAHAPLMRDASEKEKKDEHEATERPML